ncbi:hypothetical protein ACN27F_23465 [Solwaraspora sp. WMMB335]|uniref:hypothetical protein n=1 Tax=Solwaraspora sp. WMMB335 TaxID=3404118 RepID=UPI003B95D1A2
MAATQTRHDAHTGRWLRFQPDGTVAPVGSRFPRPAWEDAASAATRQGSAFLEIPAGLWWLGDPAAPLPPLSDLAFAAPADPPWCAVVTGAAGVPGPPRR